jgi:hypothetical protein
VNAGGGTSGRSARVVVGAKSPLEIDLLLNTSPCEPLSDAVPLPPLALDGVHYLQFEVPSGTLHDGINAIELFNRSRERDITDLVWVEIDIDQA